MPELQSTFSIQFHHRVWVFMPMNWKTGFPANLPKDFRLIELNIQKFSVGQRVSVPAFLLSHHLHRRGSRHSFDGVAR